MAKPNREKQADVLRRTQAQRKEHKKEQVLKAIQEILAQKKPLTFANIATVAGCSVSYLYKWDEIKAYIHELQQQKETQLNPIEEREPKPHSLKTLHEVARQRIRELEAEIRELKHHNEKLRGHVVEIYELRDECERLRTQYRELTNPTPSSKVIPLQSISQGVTTAPKTQTNDLNQEIAQMLDEIGIKLNAKLKREIARHEPHQVKLSIEAFGQYRRQTEVTNPEGCLLSMIRDEAKLNGQPTPEQATSEPLRTPSSATSNNESQKELISIDKLKSLSHLFNKTHDPESTPTEP